MTSGKSKLDRIDDFMIEEILATPDEEILTEVRSQCGRNCSGIICARKS